jgi:hypothetical protein
MNLAPEVSNTWLTWLKWLVGRKNLADVAVGILNAEFRMNILKLNLMLDPPTI